MNPHIFREYDIRGLVDTDLTEDVAHKLGLGLGTTIRRAGGTSVVLGRDCRESSDRFRDAMAPALASTGLQVIDVGVVPTPLTYFAANTLPGCGGLAMITGSHNPKEYNGFKMGVGKTTFHGHEIQALRRLIESGDFERGSGSIRTHDIVAPYQKFVRETVKVGPRKLKVVIDAGNGVGGAVAVPLFRAMGFEIVDQYCEMDANFPHHHPDPTVEENLRDLIARVASEKADLGIAYDGDADRLGVIDDAGNILWGDQLMILFSRELLKEVPGATIVGEVKCSMNLYRDIALHGGKPIMWKAGHSLIKAKMKETGAQLAGEMSGHVFWTHRYFGFDDGVYSSARLLEILSHAPRPLSQLLTDVPHTFASPEIRFDMPSEEQKFATVKRAVEICRKRGYDLVDVDGVRVQFPDGWGLIRASNTQPILVLRYEATTEPRLREIQALIAEVIAEAQR